ncbi:MAG: ABC transporter ATP-binding protein [Anaerolineae bacterium]|jgi:branched-chain amino acid transport system ATP-binding protein|nr:ABC transporter ATP-binding protein [Anaerolineae bacterium]
MISTPTPTTPLLEVTDLHTAYGAIQALRGVSFRVQDGQVVSLIGANGAGKSTILNTLSGLLKPWRGSVRFMGSDITGQRPDRIAWQRLIQVPEGRQVIANMSVLENLTVGTHIRRQDGGPTIAEDLAQIFARFPRLQERRSQKAGLLSGGEQQMLAVGRALMMRPRLLMLDEPSMGLAPLLVNQVFEIIAAIKQQGIPILLVEQNARKALTIADYVYVLERGEIVNQGRAADLRQDPALLAAYLG